MKNYDYDYDYDTYESQQAHRPDRNRRPGRKKRKKHTALKALGITALSLAVVVSSILSLAAINKTKEAGVITTATATSQPAAAASSESGILLTDVSDIVNAAMPSVVSITSRSLVSNYGANDFYRYFFGGGPGFDPQEQTREVDSGIGSGTIVGANDSELLILTSYHVVDGCSSLYVTFNDEASVDGYIKSKAEDKDIAIVAVPLADISEETRNHISIAKLCEDGVEVGDGIVIIGDALGYGQSVITGIISATDRQITTENTTMTLLQTDAAINAGNSGGCMLNDKGEIVGISEAKITDASVEGMCYAIPIKENLSLILQLMEVDAEL